MGNIILSESRKAIHPYYVSDIGVHLYTAEELCYYIYNNLMLINQDFVDDRLLDFIDELGMEALGAKLRQWKSDMSIWELLVVILQDVHYYSPSEIENFREELDRISREGYETILNEKADYMLSIGRFYDAIRMYDKLLVLPGEYIKRQKVKAAVYLSKGIAHARLFSYGYAASSFANSYELTGGETPLKYLFMAGLVTGALDGEGKPSGHTDVPEELGPDSHAISLISEADPAKKQEWLEQYRQAREMAPTMGKAYETAQLADKDERKRRSGFLELISRWKADYKRCEG